MLITPFFYLFPGNPELPIHLALALSTLLSLATLLFVYAITTQLTAGQPDYCAPACRASSGALRFSSKRSARV